MIDIIQVPQANSILLDANDTNIIVQTTNAGRYLEATITVDGAELFTQIWSLDSERKTRENLKKVLHRQFDDVFNTLAQTTGYTSVSSIKTVAINLKEREVATQNLIYDLDLPTFKILRSRNPKNLTLNNFTVLTAYSGLTRIKRGDGLRIPFFCRFTQQLSVSIKDQAGVVWYNKFFFEIPEGTHQFDFAPSDIPDLEYFTIEFDNIVDESPVSVGFEQYKFALYGFKQLYYQNTHGFYLPSTLTGLQETERGLNAQTYEDIDGQRITYEVLEEINLSLNSGFVSYSQNEMIAAIAASTDIRMQYQGIWKRWAAETKKINEFADRRTDYNHEIVFNQILNSPIENVTGYVPAPVLNPVTASGDQNSAITILKSEFVNAYSGTGAPQEIRFLSASVQGTYSVIYNGVATVIFDAGVTSEATLPKTFDLDSVDSIRYTPDYNQTGSPAETLQFQMREDSIWSNTANLSITVNEVAPGDLPPFIELEDFSIVIDGNGDGAKLIPATITDPEGDPLTYLWEIVGTYTPATFDDNTIAQPTITLDAATLNDTFQIKVTATDAGAGLSAEKTVTVTAGAYSIALTGAYDSGASTAQNSFYDLELSGGQPGESVELRYVFFGADSQQYAVVDTDLPGARIIDQYAAQYIQLNQFVEDPGAAGLSLPITHRIEVADPNIQGDIIVRAYVQNATGDQTIQTSSYELQV